MTFWEINRPFGNKRDIIVCDKSGYGARRDENCPGKGFMTIEFFGEVLF